MKSSKPKVFKLKPKAPVLKPKAPVPKPKAPKPKAKAPVPKPKAKATVPKPKAKATVPKPKTLKTQRRYKKKGGGLEDVDVNQSTANKEPRKKLSELISVPYEQMLEENRKAREKAKWDARQQRQIVEADERRALEIISDKAGEELREKNLQQYRDLMSRDEKEKKAYDDMRIRQDLAELNKQIQIQKQQSQGPARGLVNNNTYFPSLPSYEPHRDDAHGRTVLFDP